ncbi:hypothetical protein NHQ30_006424 [Ciborinia camelliae]|nr:hypothetical protein NHQ30_006424 [Ciborinia camelliae]
MGDACKLMMVHELTKRMSFKSMVSWIQLNDGQLIDFIRVYEIQSQRNIEEEKLTLTAMNRLSEIRKRREVTTRDWDRALKEEIDSKLGPSMVDSPIPSVDIGQTIKFLQSFPVQEELAGLGPEDLQSFPVQEELTGLEPEDLQLEPIILNDSPSFLVIQGVIESMKRYTKLSVEMEWDFDHDIGIVEYIYRETVLAGDVDDPTTLSGHEGGEESEEPVRRPVGRPKKRGRQFSNKPLRNKSDLFRLRQPSSLQQVESIEDEGEGGADGMTVDEGNQQL